MFSRQFSRSIFGSHFTLVVAAACAGVAAGATPPVAGWHSSGNSTATTSGAAAASSSGWRLPGSQQATTTTQASEPTANPVNPLRPNRSASKSPREPNTFAAPTGATQIAAASSRNNNSSASTKAQRGTPSAAVAQTAAVLPSKSAATNVRSAATGRFTPNQRAARATQKAGLRPSPHAPIWQRLNVAMQGPEDHDVEAEDLPLPGHIGEPMHDPLSDPFGPPMMGEYGDEYYPTCGPDGCGDACEPGCACGPGGGDGCCCGGECANDCFCIGPGDPESCHSVRIRVPKWHELTIFGGAHGFKGPYDQQRDSGNFGFHEGFNSGFKIPYTYAGYQIGYQAAHSQLNGDKDTRIEDSHTQHFITFGLFRRVEDGLQFGTAWDVLRDQRFDAVDFHQLRTEISWMDCGRHEFGFAATVGLNEYDIEDNDDNGDDNDNDQVNEASIADSDYWQASDQYLLFYRVHGKRGGEGRIFGGWNDASDGILGTDMHLPVHDRWSVQTGFTYMIPDARNGRDGASEEAWNLNLSLVWHWGCRARKGHDSPYRPLFNVANNGTLIIDNREDD